MPTPVDRRTGSGYPSADSASELEESWSKISTLERGKKREDTSKLATPGPKDDLRYGDQSTVSSSSQTLSSVSANTSRPKNTALHHKRATSLSSASQSSITTGSTVTPSKGKNSSAVGTPASRAAAMIRHFSGTSDTPEPSQANAPQSKVPMGTSNTPRPSQAKASQSKTSMAKDVSRPILKVIEIEDSTDDDSDATDTDTDGSPTRPSERNPVPNDSSLSSVEETLFPVSATSSFSSVGSSNSFAAPKPGSSSKPGTVVIDGAFSSLTITPRRNQKGTTVVSPSAASSSDKTTSTDSLGARAISKFANSSFGVDLETFIIAHDNLAQTKMDALDIAWGTQYELARGVSKGSWTWNDVFRNLSKLKCPESGSAKAKGAGAKSEDIYSANTHSAWKVRLVMAGRDVESVDPPDLSVWKELDREQEAIHENVSRGLGLMGKWGGIPDWYGGRIQQIVRLVKEENSSFKLKLEPLEQTRSHRFARFYGSRRFLHLRISEDLLKTDNEKIKAFLLQKFILCGRVFVPFHTKEEAVYMVETNENHNRSSRTDVSCADHFRLSFQEFINWHNPLDVAKNYKQVISKYAARFALGLSNSFPGLEFQDENIFFIPDITTDDWPSHKPNPPAEKLMTDGCGFLNHAALFQIVQVMGYDSLPAGVQGRIDGSKGFWILHPHDDSPEPKIWIRDSQNKIKNRTFDRAHRIFDLLAPSRPSPSASITPQSIINLFNNGMPREMLARLMDEGLEEEVAPLLDWNRPHVMLFLWDVINKLGNVAGGRTQRLATSLNRALGLKGRDWGRDDDGDQDKDEFIDQDEPDEEVPLGYTGRSHYSSAPLALNEVALEMLQAGFHPASNFLLHSKISYIVQNTIDSFVKRYRIPINESLGAYIVPDPLGVLEEGEIYYKFSRPRKDPKTEMLIHTLEGEVVLGRYPIRLPSDMQKAMAVDKRELDKWTDVIIVSVKGTRSLASKLADGDMDGDELIVIFNPEIVSKINCKPFTNAPVNFLDDNFEASSRVETVEGFCLRTATLSPRQTSEAFLEHLISNLTQSQVGLYSMMHEVSTITQGYEHPESIRLAYIFATLLDSSKTGHRLKQDVLKRDLRKYRKGSTKSDDPTSASRDILHYLTRTASNKGHELLGRFHESELKFFNRDSKEFKEDKDPDLILPHLRSIEFAKEVKRRTTSNDFMEELWKIENHVKAVKRKYNELCAKKGQTQASKSSSKNPKKIVREEPLLPCTRMYAQPIPGVFLTPNVEQVKAAYAYSLHTGFGFTVAFRELCSIKAAACTGGLAPSIRSFDEGKSFSASFLRALKRSQED